MKSVEFTGEEFDIEKAKKALFEDENDPRSYSYVRVLVRPRINWLKVLFFIFLPPIALFFLACLMHRLGIEAWICACVAVALWGIFLFLNLRRAAICAVKIYQRYAPDALRNRCRYEPSCSQYMIISIEKYGFWRGIVRGFRRMKRCNTSGGGYDLP